MCMSAIHIVLTGGVYMYNGSDGDGGTQCRAALYWHRYSDSNAGQQSRTALYM